MEELQTMCLNNRPCYSITNSCGNLSSWSTKNKKKKPCNIYRM